jgi:queuosine precursor transporter
MIGYLAFALFTLTIPAANWLIGNVGTVCIPSGPCLIPVGFGLDAPSGVLMIGTALVLRDIVHERLGATWALAAIAAGAVLSWFVAAPALVVASVAAFTLAELADFAVYAPLRRKRLVLAVMASGLVGAVVDSAVFLWLAFGSLAHVEGQIVGKLWMSAAAAVVLVGIRRCWFGHRWAFTGPDLPYVGVVGECARCGTREHVGNPMP